MDEQVLYKSILLLIGRIFIAGLFYQDAIFNKIMHADSSMALMSSIHLPYPKILLILVVAFELVAATMFVFGFYTKVIACLFAAFCIAVSFMFHQFWAYPDFPTMQNQMNHFMKNVAIAGGMIYIMFFS